MQIQICHKSFLKALFKPVVGFVFSGFLCPSDPPDQPKNISCINKVISNESGVVFCTWNRGRDTYLRNSSELRWVRKDWKASNLLDVPPKNIIYGCISCPVKLGFVCFRVRTSTGNHTVGPVTRSVFRKGTDLRTVSFTVSSSVQLISVWVQAQNSLGFAVSLPINYTLSDIGKTTEVTDCWSCEVHGIFCLEPLCFTCNGTT